MAKQIDDPKKCSRNSERTHWQGAKYYIIYLYILETLAQRHPKSCIAVSSSELLIYPRIISSLNLLEKPLRGMFQQIFPRKKNMNRKWKLWLRSIRDLRLILKKSTRKRPMFFIDDTWLTIADYYLGEHHMLEIACEVYEEWIDDQIDADFFSILIFSGSWINLWQESGRSICGRDW